MQESEIRSEKGGSTYYVIQFFRRGGGRDLRFCMTDDDGDYGTKKINFFFGGGAKPPRENFGEFRGVFQDFCVRFLIM